MKFDPETIAQYVDENLYEGSSGFTVPKSKPTLSEGIAKNLGILIHREHPDQITVYNTHDNTKLIMLKLARPITMEQIESLNSRIEEIPS
jgi:hypothetical protein